MSNISSLLTSFDPNYVYYENLYKQLHANPGLSLQESLAASIAADQLRKHGYKVKSNIGGYGVIGILENGTGKTILLRADTDALPVLEKTDLPYASKKKEVDVEDQIEKPVMHACGHDMHIACMLAAAESLSRMKAHWHGTVVILFQPNEERGKGARAMVDDGLYNPTRHGCPIPDIVLGQHVMPFPAGKVGTRQGVVAAAADSLKITVYGRGGHASQPHRTVDPVVLAAHIILRLQNIVSREVSPSESAVVTVGAVQAGLTSNIISDHAVLHVTVRNNDSETRIKVLGAIKRIVEAECLASDCPKPPEIETVLQVPLTTNDRHITMELERTFKLHFGEEYSDQAAPLGGSEDFAILAESINRPYCYWTFGGSDPNKWSKAEQLGRLQDLVPVNHSPFFAPPLQPTMRTGTDALLISVLTFLGKDLQV